MTLPSRLPSVVSLGYCTLDAIRYQGQVTHRAGGTAANVATNLAYLGWDATFIGRLGRDTAARRITDDLRRSSVSVDLVERDIAVESPTIVHDVNPPVHTFLFRCPTCRRRFPRHRPISEAHLSSVLARELSADVFFFDRASAPALRLAAEFRARGSVIMFEPSAPGVSGRTLAAAELAHILKCSHERRKAIDPGLLVARRGQLQIETLGPNGLRFRKSGGAWREVLAPTVAVVDPGGAGDWLTAALLDRLAPVTPADIVVSATRNALHQAQGFAALSCRFVGSRTLTDFPLNDVRRAAAEVLVGHEPTLGAPRRRGPSKARASCAICLR